MKLNKDDIKVYLKKSGGSRFNKEMPYIKTEIIFNAAFSMRKIVRAVCLLLINLALLDIRF